MLEITAFKKGMPEVNFLRAVSVKMKAKEAKKKMKNLHLPLRYLYFIHPSPFGFSHQCL